MKRYIYILLSLLTLPMMAGIHSYTDQSVLSSGHWVKIRVSESGVCRMSFSELQNAGLNPQQLRVFGYGGAMLDQDFTKKKIDDLPQVPVYVGSDYVLFWVQGPISWKYGNRYMHTRNIYSDYGYYLLTDNVGSLLAPTESAAVTGTPAEVTYYQLYQVHEKDSLNLVDVAGVEGCGREFYGEQFSLSQRRSFTFATPNALEGKKSLIYAVLASKSSGAASTFNVGMNGNTNSVKIGAIPDTDFYTKAYTNNTLLMASNTGNEQVVNIQYTGSTPGSLGWLNYIEITTPCALSMNGNWMPIRTDTNYMTNVPVRFHLSGANSNIQIWDVTNLSQISKMPTTLEGNELQWIGSQKDGVHEYVAVNTQGNSGYVEAKVMGEVANQNLHALSNIDYVIICPDSAEIVSAARDLAKAHEAKEGITWAVVTNQQVFNEFSSGTPDATAYRWLMKMLYDRADGGAIAKPRWLLLMGHGSFDNRKLLPKSGTNLILTYEASNSTNEVNAYMSDDYFGWLDDNEGTNDVTARMDIGVGRLPIDNAKEAREVVNKLIAYIRNEEAGSWKNQIIFLADDGESGKHTTTAEAGAEKVRKKNPDFIVNKIYLDAYPQEVNASGESYPLAKNRLDNLLKRGALFFDYSGHGGYNAITNESILNIQEIEKMSNKHHAFWLFATCNFAHCDAGERSAAEAAVLNPIGAAIGVLSATRTVYADQNTLLNGNVCDTLFGHKNAFHYDMTLGEAVAIGKNRTGGDANKLAYVLLGDPAIRLNYPTNYQVQTLTKIDTLNALSVQHVEGQIIDEDSVVVSDFNGKVDITVYDKLQVIRTRDNDCKTEGKEVELQYNDYPNTIFSGAADVKNGQFNYTFMVPKDIRYNYGNGRIVYYAYTADSLELAEAVGHFEDFTVGGTGNILTADTTGPQMTIYLNTPAFVDGGKTYETPRFFADLYDEHGINTAGAGIGHDLLLIVDNDPKMTYSLNEYFTSASGSYQEGQVSYMMEKMTDGPHSLSFRAWDMLNNSTTQTLNFVVETGLDPSIYSVVTYPNPVQATGIVNLVVNYDQPDEALETDLCLYNLSGQLVWRHNQSNPDQVQIKLSEIGLTPGIYIYNVKIKSETSRYSKSSGKIIVTE